MFVYQKMNECDFDFRMPGSLRWKTAPVSMTEMEESAMYERIRQKNAAGIPYGLPQTAQGHNAQESSKENIYDDIELGPAPVTTQPRPETPDIDVTVM